MVAQPPFEQGLPHAASRGDHECPMRPEPAKPTGGARFVARTTPRSLRADGAHRTSINTPSHNMRNEGCFAFRAALYLLEAPGAARLADSMTRYATSESHREPRSSMSRPPPARRVRTVALGYPHNEASVKPLASATPSRRARVAPASSARGSHCGPSQYCRTAV